MKIGIMQPYFFPYLGYFGCIAHTDQWIIFDPVQYIRKGWINRNRVLKQGGGWKHIGFTPMKHARSTLIKDIKISTTGDWPCRIFNHLDYYEKRAPYYDEVISLLRSTLSFSDPRAPQFLNNALRTVCEYLEVPYHGSIYSEMNLEHQPASHPGEWALRISEALGATEYINPAGGREIFYPEQFHNAGIRLRFYEQELPEYDQRNKAFEPGLSIIDVMMFNSVDEIQGMLNRNSLAPP